MTKSFYEKVYEKVRLVPSGKVITYKDLANSLNSKAYRAVGSAMKNNPNIPSTPCHRVVKSNGWVGEYSTDKGIIEKITRLNNEGVEVDEMGFIDLKKYSYKFS